VSTCAARSDAGHAVVEGTKHTAAFVNGSYHHTTSVLDARIAPIVNGTLDTMLVRVA
jgi:hypothetical protein